MMDYHFTREYLEGNLIPEDLIPFIWHLIPYDIRLSMQRGYKDSHRYRLGFCEWHNWYLIDLNIGYENPRIILSKKFGSE